MMKNKIQFVLCLLSSFLFIFSGANKIFQFVPTPPDLPEKMVKMNAAMMEIGWLMPVLAVVEIGAGLLFIFKKHVRLQPLCSYQFWWVFFNTLNS